MKRAIGNFSFKLCQYISIVEPFEFIEVFNTVSF